MVYHFWMRIFSGLVPTCAAMSFLRSPIVSSSLHFTLTFRTARTGRVLVTDREPQRAIKLFYGREGSNTARIRCSYGHPFSCSLQFSAVWFAFDPRLASKVQGSCGYTHQRATEALNTRWGRRVFVAKRNNGNTPSLVFFGWLTILISRESNGQILRG